jgi:hypothetical protein
MLCTVSLMQQERHHVSSSPYNISMYLLFTLFLSYVGHYTLAASDYLFHAIDVLVLLSLSPNTYVAKEARQIMRDCLTEIDGIKFMREHHVPKRSSPIFAGDMNFDDASTFNLEYYDQYPQPWFAMMYDASRYIASL